MFDVMVPASFQYRHRPEHIAVDVGERVLDTVADPGLGAEMNYAFELLGGKQIRDRVAIREVELHKFKLRPLFKNIQARVFERDVVVLAEIVEADDFVTALQ